MSKKNFITFLIILDESLMQKKSNLTKLKTSDRIANFIQSWGVKGYPHKVRYNKHYTSANPRFGW